MTETKDFCAFSTQVEKAIKKFIRNKKLNNILDSDG